MKAPKNKLESSDLFARGRYGNNIATYADPLEAIVTSSGEDFVIRYNGEPGIQGPAIFGINAESLHDVWAMLISQGWNESRLYVNDAIDTDFIVFQGELSTGNWAHPDWHLSGSCDPNIHMREAMKRRNFELDGSAARYYLKEIMSAPSWDDLNMVIDEWPDGVIELVVFDRPYGSLANHGRSAIVWEIRAY